MDKLGKLGCWLVLCIHFLILIGKPLLSALRVPNNSPILSSQFLSPHLVRSLPVLDKHQQEVICCCDD